MDVIKILKVIADINFALEAQFILNFYTQGEVNNEICVKLSSQDNDVNVSWVNILAKSELHEDTIIAELIQHVQGLLNEKKEKVNFYENLIGSIKNTRDE